MTESQFNKKEIERLIKIPGETRGQGLIGILKYVEEKKGKEGVKLLKQKIEELGFSLDKLEELKWYPVGLVGIFLIVTKRIFNWGEKEIFEIGGFGIKIGFIPKILSRYFVSLFKIFQTAPMHWKKYFTIGEMEPYQLNEKEKYLIVRLKNFKIHPLVCFANQGSFLQIAQYVIESKKITIEETKCMFKGDPYHEFLIKWK